MEFHLINKKELKKFGLIFGIMLSIIGTAQLLKGNTKLYPWFYALGLYAIASALFVPHALKPIYFLLNKIGRIITTLITASILIIVFYFVLMPIGLIARLFGNAFLDINFKKQGSTYWITKEAQDDNISQYERQF